MMLARVSGMCEPFRFRPAHTVDQSWRGLQCGACSWVENEAKEHNENMASDEEEQRRLQETFECCKELAQEAMQRLEHARQQLANAEESWAEAREALRQAAEARDRAKKRGTLWAWL